MLTCFITCALWFSVDGTPDGEVVRYDQNFALRTASGFAGEVSEQIKCVYSLLNCRAWSYYVTCMTPRSCTLPVTTGLFWSALRNLGYRSWAWLTKLISFAGGKWFIWTLKKGLKTRAILFRYHTLSYFHSQASTFVHVYNLIMHSECCFAGKQEGFDFPL